jgi:hypothetical protein
MTQPKTIRLWIGNEPEPAERLQIEVSPEDAARIPIRGSRSRRVVTVTDLLTNKLFTVRRAACGLPGCFCALALAEPKFDPEIAAAERKAHGRSKGAN